MYSTPCDTGTNSSTAFERSKIIHHRTRESLKIFFLTFYLNSIRCKLFTLVKTDVLRNCSSNSTETQRVVPRTSEGIQQCSLARYRQAAQTAGRYACYCVWLRHTTFIQFRVKIYPPTCRRAPIAGTQGSHCIAR
jgi:hypothetical protein